MARLQGQVAIVTGGSRGTADVTDLAAVESMVGRVISELGPVDILVNNAGSNSTRLFSKEGFRTALAPLSQSMDGPEP